MTDETSIPMTLLTWDEECSYWTPGACWTPGGEYYAVTISRWVPTALLDDEPALNAWLEAQP